jgi:hypothetical protein
MKKIIYIGIFLLTTVSFSQNVDLNLNQFVGNWEYNNGTETFKVELFSREYENEIYLAGNYQLINNTNGMLIYKSNKTISNNGATATLGSQITLWFNGVTNLISGTVTDNVLFDGTGNTGTGKLWCNLSIEIQDSCSTCPTTAIWKVKCSGPKIGQPTQPTIPTDIILTKVN